MRRRYEVGALIFLEEYEGDLRHHWNVPYRKELFFTRRGAQRYADWFNAEGSQLVVRDTKRKKHKHRFVRVGYGGAGWYALECICGAKDIA